jgi:lipid-A-disaccharide synthase-like uncharacterized protein
VLVGGVIAYAIFMLDVDGVVISGNAGGVFVSISST